MKTAADVLIDVLQRWGVEVVFGLPGDGINGIMESLRQRQDAIRFIQVRHEESAAFMACAYAKYTGRLGVCLAISGPGGLHLLNAWELGKRLADDAIVSSDSGTIATWFARQIKARREQMFSLSGTLASMANGLPYAIAAQVAHPGRQCIAFVRGFVTISKGRAPFRTCLLRESDATLQGAQPLRAGRPVAEARAPF